MRKIGRRDVYCVIGIPVKGTKSPIWGAGEERLPEWSPR